MGNMVCLIGRLTKDPDVRYGAESQMAVARFSIAIDRGKNKDGDSKGTDFPSIVCFGKTAEVVEKYLTKGKLVGIFGHIQTGKYEKDGKTIYTTEVVVDKLDLIDWGEKKDSGKSEDASSDVPEGFAALTDDDIPF